MEPTRESLSPALDAASPSWGELILQNGRLAGASHRLEAPLILVGDSPSCDIRLRASAIRPLHCAISVGPGGVLLRELESKGGTRVNGNPAEHRYLQNGDEIAFGPFRFMIRLSGDAPQPADARPHHSGAAVEEKRRLVELRRHANEVRAVLREERAEHEQQTAAAVKTLADLKQEVEAGRRTNQVEKRRLLQLRLRLRQRLHRHWTAERAAMRKREDIVATSRRALEKDFEHLQKERQELYRARLQHNGESELGKRQLREAWNRLDEERGRFAQELARRQAEQNARGRDLETREIDLADAERLLASEQRRWEERRLQIDKEVEGLDARVRHQRRKLLVQEEKLRRRAAVGPEIETTDKPSAESAAPMPAAAPAARFDANLERRVAELDRLATDLADQRLYLAEQCERFHRARKKWQQEHTAAVAAMEPLAQQLHDREQGIREREQALAVEEAVGEQSRQQLAQQRRFLDTWQARLATRAAVWEVERDRLMEEMRAREENAETQLAAMAQIQHRWQQRQVQELDRAQGLLIACEQLRAECTNLREEWARRTKSVDQERQGLAERELALEETRRALLRRSDDPAAIEPRLRRLREKWHVEFQSATQAVVRERLQLGADGERIQEFLGQLRKHLADLAGREAEMTRREREHEHQDLRQRVDHGAMRSELERHRTQRAAYERQLQMLKEEVERLASAMLDAGESEPPVARAA